MITTIVGALAGGIAAMTSSHLRGLLASIFRRPRETSVIVEVDGKRVELHGVAANPEALQALIQQMMRDTAANKADAVSEDSADGLPGGASHE